MALQGFTLGSGSSPEPASPTVAASAGNSGVLKGFSLGQTNSPASVPATAPTPAPQQPMATPVSTPDTSGFFSKFLGSFKPTAVGKGLDILGKLTAQPDAAAVGKDPSELNRTLAYLPSELARTIPGVAQIQDDTAQISEEPQGPKVLPQVISQGRALTAQKADIDAQQGKVDTTDQNAITDFNDKVAKYNADLAHYQKTVEVYNNASDEDQKQGRTGYAGIEKYLDKDTVNKSIVPGAIDFGKGSISAPLAGVADIAGAVRQASNQEGAISYDIPGLGTITNTQFNIAQRIANGEDPAVVGISEGSKAFLDVLSLVGMIKLATDPRFVTVAQSEGTIEGSTNTPKTGRLYEPSVASTNARVLTPGEVQSLKLGSRFTPEQPVFLRSTLGKGGKFTTEIVQIKPSYLESAYTKLFGSKSANVTLPSLIQEAPLTEDQTSQLVQSAKPGDTTVLHSSEVKAGDIVNSINKSSAAAALVPQAPSPAIPAIPSTALTVAHNALRLTGGDTAQASGAAATLRQEIKDSIAQHGSSLTHTMLQEKLGVDVTTADTLIREAKASYTDQEFAKLNQRALSIATAPKALKGFTVNEAPPQIEGVNPKQETRLSNEEAAPLAKAGADTYYEKVVAPAIKEGRAVVIGSDDIKDYFGKDYNSNNHPVYSQAANGVYERALKETKADTVKFTVGGTGAGKSDFLVPGESAGFKGIIYDSTGSNYEGLKKQIDLAKAAGKKVEIYGVVPDLIRSRAYTHLREINGEHPVSEKAFVSTHSKAIDTLIKLIEDGAEVHVIDTRNIHTEADFNAADYVQNPLATLESARYSEEDVKTFTKHVTKENAEDLIAGRTDGTEELSSEDRAAQDSIRTRNIQTRGFVRVPALPDIGAKIAEVKDFIDQNKKTTELTGTVTDAIYQHEGGRKANRQRAIQLLQARGQDLSAQEWETLYHHDEDSNVPLTEKEAEIYKEVIIPLKEALTLARAEYRDLGGVITNDLKEGQTPRFAKEKGGPIDKILALKKKSEEAIRNGGLMSKSVGAGAKHRIFHVAVDEAGNRTVVAIPTAKGENVTAFRKGVLTDLGPVAKKVTPKVKEFFDPAVREKLETLAKNLGVTHERHATGRTAGLGGQRAGVSFAGENLIKTRLSPDSTLAHELGHQIDHKYGMQAVMKEERYDALHKRQVTEEMRALADARFAGKDVTDSAKSYVRKGTEKMAVMFEAYISNKEMFKDIAPHLYDAFSDFLSEHKELQPFLDIEHGVELDMTTHGGELSGKSGKTFVDQNGKKYKIVQATTKEIEANTKTRYHKNPLANYILSYDRTSTALSALKFLDRLKSTPEFSDLIVKQDPDEAPPEGWQDLSGVLPQFRGYYAEPKLAEALQDLASRLKGREPFPVLDEVNNLLTSLIVLNPIMHFPNVAQGWATAEAATGKVPVLSSKSRANFAKAVNEVKNKGPIYLSYLEHGAPLMALKNTARDFTDAVLTQYAEVVEQKPDEFAPLAKVLGYANPMAWFKGLNHINEAVTWGGNDIMFLHAILDYADKNGSTPEEAIKAVSKRMADYRLPSRLGPSKLGRAISLVMQSRGLLFARYHYSGVIKPWVENIKDSAGPKATAKERIAGLRSLAYLGLMAFLVYPYINKLLQGLTGDDKTYISMAGATKLVQNTEKLYGAGSAGIPAFAQSTFTLSPALTAAIELGFNVDLYTRNPIYGNPPAQGLGQFGVSMVAPLSSGSRMSPGDFALSLLGIYTPKTVSGQNALNAQKYDELPALQVQVKKDIVEGNMDKATAEMAEFNNRAIANWNTFQLQTGGQPLAADGSDNEEFLKEWGISIPGEKALANASALYADGSLTSKSSLLDNISTYAKAIGDDPATAFERIFTGQQILRVDNFGILSPDSAIIVQRLPLASSEAIRSKQAAAQGISKDQLGTMQLDHFIPLEAGGSNDESNLDLVTTYQNEVLHNDVETPIAAALRNGDISRAKAQEYLVRFKIGTLGEIPNQKYIDLYKNKYGSQPITAAEIVAEINAGKAK